MSQAKVCARCKQEKPFSEFWAHKKTLDGLQAWCKDCFSGYRSEQQGQRRRDYRIEKEQMLSEQAIQTRNWMLRVGAYFDGGEEGGVPGFVSVPEICRFLNLSSKRQWYPIRKVMLRLGIPIAVHPFGGHYIGPQGSQAKIVANMAKRAMSLLQHCLDASEAMMESGHWSQCLDVLEESLSDRQLLPGDLVKIAEAIGADIEDKERFEQKLLPQAG